MSSYLLVTKEFSQSPTSGGAQRTLAVADELARHGEIVVVSPQGTYRRGPDGASWDPPLPQQDRPLWRLALAYRSLGAARLCGSTLLQHLDRALQRRYDAAVVDHTCLAHLAGPVARAAPQVILSTHNVESHLMAQRATVATGPVDRLSMRVEAWLLRRLERSVGSSHPVVVVSEADARMLGSPPSVVVCRNGIFRDRIAASRGPVPPASLLFTGALDWGPNADGLVWFVTTGWDRVRAAVPEATLTIAGRNPSDAVLALGERPGVTVVGDPADMRPLLARAAVGVVPLLAGGGSRIKILEYLAGGLDIVSTAVGASGLEDVPTALMDRTSDEGFVDGLIARLRSPRDNSDEAPQWVERHYTWDATLEPLGKLLVRST